MRRNWRRRAAERQERSPGASKTFGVVDLGTTALRFLVVEAGQDQATVWGWGEKSGPGTLGADPKWLASACDEALDEAEEMAQDLSGHWILPDQILVGLPASQLRGQAWTITQARSRPERPVEERELEALLGRTLRLAANRLSSEAPDTAKWLLLDSAPVALTVDGRGVTDLVGFRGQEIGATVFAALAPLPVIDTWGRVARELEFSTLTLVAAPLAVAAGLPATQGLLVDVGGESTDLTWFRARRPIVLDSLPVGASELTRTLVRRWGLSLDKAERLKRAYVDKQLPEDAQAEVWSVMSPALRAWLEQIEQALAVLNRDEPLPQQLHLFGGGSTLAEMVDALRSLAWSEHLLFTRYPQVNRLKPTDVLGVVNQTESGRKLGDVSALALAAWTVGHNRLPDRASAILSELCHE
jgi:hypothetical protein